MAGRSVNWEIGTAGDAIRRRVTIDRTLSKVPTGVVITKAWLTVKALASDPDPGLVQKVITTTDDPGTGHIENDGGGDVDFVVRFDLTRSDTLAIGTLDVEGSRVFDVQILASDGNPYTPENGKVTCRLPEVTVASS